MRLLKERLKLWTRTSILQIATKITMTENQITMVHKEYNPTPHLYLLLERLCLPKVSSKKEREKSVLVCLKSTQIFCRFVWACVMVLRTQSTIARWSFFRVLQKSLDKKNNIIIIIITDFLLRARDPYHIPNHRHKSTKWLAIQQCALHNLCLHIWPTLKGAKHFNSTFFLFTTQK